MEAGRSGADAKLMRRNPFVCILALIALTTHKWGASEPRGRSKRHRCAPVLPRSHLSARNVRARAVHIGPGQQQRQRQQGGTMHTPVLPRPPFGGTSKLGRRVQVQAKRHQTMHARTPTPPPFGGGRPSYKSACTVGQGQRHDASEGWVMRGGDGSWRLLQDKNWSSHCRWPNTPGYDSPGRNVSCALSVKKQWWTCH